MNPFDALETQVFSVVLNTMGEDAIWLKSDGSSVPGRILFKYPTLPTTIGEADTYEYKPVTPTAEWYKDTFVGLKELSDGQNDEYIEIRDDKYFVIRVETKFDGDTYVAQLELTEK